MPLERLAMRMGPRRVPDRGPRGRDSEVIFRGLEGARYDADVVARWNIVGMWKIFHLSQLKESNTEYTPFHDSKIKIRRP